MIIATIPGVGRFCLPQDAPGARFYALMHGAPKDAGT